MLDVLIAGAGPAGSVAALVLARAGARVLLVDRERFPRDKLCGDTLNPGAIALLDSLGLTGGARLGATPLRGMVLTGRRASVSASYPGGRVALSLRRSDLDAWLLDEAVRAGARFESGLTARRPLIDDSQGAPIVRGLVVSSRAEGRDLRLPAKLTVAADGRRSAVARSAGLIAPSRAPRRWAFGGYASGVEGMTAFGEMHIRSGWYVGIAPVGPLVNVCVVTGPRPAGRTPEEVIRLAVSRDATLARRLASARFEEPVRVLGPLATDAPLPGTTGLLLAGDAAGFIDPMTGDGMHLAMQSAILAAEQALVALETGDVGTAPLALARARQRAFGTKLRFNRLVRRVVDSPLVIDLAGLSATVIPGWVRRAIYYAGDAR